MPVLERVPIQCIDMAILLEDQLSANLGKTAEGYLICKDVPIARTGIQRYYGEEIGLTDYKDRGQVFDVYRVPDEVFSRESLMSMEGKPVTDGHPKGNFVMPENYAAYAKGHVRNVRKMGDHVVADLVINDPVLINKVENKVVRQVSVGYSCFYSRHQDGYKQVEIRGNHIAVVEQGRAGSKVSIKDNKPKGKKKMNKAQLRANMLKAFAVDADPDDLVAAMSLLEGKDYAESAPATKVKDADLETKKDSVIDKLLNIVIGKVATKDEDGDDDKKDDDKEKKTEDRLTALETNVGKILDAVTGKKAKINDEDEDKKDLEEAMGTEDEDGDADEDDDKKETSDSRESLLAMAREMKPFIAKLPTKDQNAIKAKFLKALGGTKDSENTYGEIQKIVQKSAKENVSDAESGNDYANVGRLIAMRRNPHYQRTQKQSS